MEPDPAPSARYQKVADDHAALKALLHRIDHALDSRGVDIAEVGRMLGELGDRLVRHFALEEEGGYFSEALLHSPRLVDQANALMAQHPKMCAQADVLCQVAGAASNAETWWTNTRQRFRAFKEELLRHERAEDGLMQEAYQQDLGSHD